MKPLVVLWTTALAVAAVGTWVLFDGAWGVNAAVWTVTACACLLLCAARGGRISSALVVTLTLAMLLAGGTAVTADWSCPGLMDTWVKLPPVVLRAGARRPAD